MRLVFGLDLKYYKRRINSGAPKKRRWIVVPKKCDVVLTLVFTAIALMWETFSNQSTTTPVIGYRNHRLLILCSGGDKITNGQYVRF